MTFDEFIKTNKGKYLDFDGKYSAQCFDLFQYYNRDVLGGGFVGGMYAKDIWNTYPKNLYTPIRNTPNGVPQKGDVVVWGGSYNGGVGHVGMATGKGDVNSFEAFVQNDPLGSPSILKKYNYDHVIGWLRPITNNEVGKLKTRITELELQVEELRANRDKYRTQYATIKELYEELKKQAQEYKDVVAEQDEVIHSALSENAKLKQEIKDLKQKKQVKLSDFSKQELLKALFS